MQRPTRVFPVWDVLFTARPSPKANLQAYTLILTVPAINDQITLREN